MKTFVIELDNRVDGDVNSSIKGYSTKAFAMSEFYKRCGAAVSSTDFTSVVLEVTRADGQILKRDVIKTAYVPPVPPEPEEPEEPEEGDEE